MTIEKEEESPPEHPECDISTIQADADCEIASRKQELQAKPTAMVQDETTAEVQEGVPDENTAEVLEDVPEEVTAEVQSEVQESTTAEIPEGTTVAVSTETVLLPDLAQKCDKIPEDLPVTEGQELEQEQSNPFDQCNPPDKARKVMEANHSSVDILTNKTTKMVTYLLLLHYLS